MKLRNRIRRTVRVRVCVSSRWIALEDVSQVWRKLWLCALSVHNPNFADIKLHPTFFQPLRFSIDNPSTHPPSAHDAYSFLQDPQGMPDTLATISNLDSRTIDML